MRFFLLGLHLFGGCVLTLSGCATGPDVDEMIKDSPRGSVYLERIADRSFQAAHPIKLDVLTIARILRGVHVRDDHSTLQTFFSGKPDALRAFSDEEVTFLTPLIAEGLRRAAPDQQVGFRIAQIGIPGHAHNTGGGVGSSEPPLTLHPRESTTGVIHAYGRSLYLTLTEYRLRAEPANTINMANRRLPDDTGLINHTVLFVPEAAKRPDSYLDARSTDKTLVIDYELLCRFAVFGVVAADGPTAGHDEGKGKPGEERRRDRSSPEGIGRDQAAIGGAGRRACPIAEQIRRTEVTTLGVSQPVLRVPRPTAPPRRFPAWIFVSPCFAAEST
jgi:hypothetical protein